MSHAPGDALKRRHHLVRKMLAERSLDALVVTSLPNVLYLTNFGGSSAIVVLTAEQLLFVTDFRYVEAIEETRGRPYECPGLELITVDSAYDATLAGVLGGMASARVGFEAANLSVARHAWLEAALGKGAGAPSLVPTEGLVEAVRVRKDDYELAVLKEAARRLSVEAWPDRARDRARHRLAHASRRVREAGLRYDCRRGAQCGASSCPPG
jgi:Xaa-Pro aminopeptidase